jgi:hypothetical protein
MHDGMLLWRYHQSLPTCGVSLADVQLEGLDGIAHAHTQRPTPAHSSSNNTYAAHVFGSKTHSSMRVSIRAMRQDVQGTRRPQDYGKPSVHAVP